jgi:hypothetical protein
VVEPGLVAEARERGGDLVRPDDHCLGVHVRLRVETQVTEEGSVPMAGGRFGRLSRTHVHDRTCQPCNFSIVAKLLGC